MSRLSLVTDTHPLLNYFCGAQKKLSKKVKRAFDDAVVDQKTTIYVPSIVLWETSSLIEKGSIALKAAFAEWVESLFSYRTLIPQPFDEQTAILCDDLRFHGDPFDRAIVATALQLGLPLITNDGVIHERKPCLVYWD